MPLFSTLDLVALAWFLSAWAIYSFTLSKTEKSKQGLNSEMNRFRDVWMFQMLARETRMVDAQIVAALQNGTAFFASTSLIAIGGALTLLRSSEEVLQVMAALPFGIAMTAVQWEAKRAVQRIARPIRRETKRPRPPRPAPRRTPCPSRARGFAARVSRFERHRPRASAARH
jgi:uncharacterized membrane protein